MRSTTTFLALFVAMLPGQGFAWGNKTTHPELTDSARERFGDFDEILHDS